MPTNQPASQPVPSPNFVYMSRYATVCQVCCCLSQPLHWGGVNWHALGKEKRMNCLPPLPRWDSYTISLESLLCEPGQCLGCPGKTRRGRKLQKWSLCFVNAGHSSLFYFLTILFSIILLGSEGVYPCCIPPVYFVTLHQLLISH